MSGNPFAVAEVAARYAAGRPYLHPTFMARLSAALRGRARGADVACGTGLSSLALAEVVQEVLAYDISEPMLRRAAAHPRVHYAQASASALPLPSHSLDVLTVSQAFYWLPHQSFLQEARRVLRPDGLLYIYDFYFVGQMLTPSLAPDPLFYACNEAFLRRYPPPMRPREVFGPQEAAQAGFLLLEQHFPITWSFDLAGLCAYLLTLPGPSAALQRQPERAAQTAQEITQWLREQLAPLFAEQPLRLLRFGGWEMLLRPYP